MPDFGPDFGRSDFGPSVDGVHRADSFVDALAHGGPVAPQDSADAELAALLGGWRDEMRWPPATGLIAEADAVAALNAGLAEKRRGLDRDRRVVTQPRHSRRGLSTVGAAAAAVLCIGGFGAVVAGAGPGDALYGVRNMLFGAPKQVRDDQVGLAAKTELNQVQDLISQGDWEQAQDKLVAVSTQVATIDNEQQKQELLDQFNDLSAKVVERDPAATAPPGVVYTVPPSAAALVPAVEPSAPGSTSLTTSTTPEPSTSLTTSATASTSSPVSTPSTSAAPASTSATASASTSASAGSTSPSTTSVVQQSQSTTAATSAAPTATSTTAAAPSTTAAPASAEQTTAAPVTTSVEAPRAVNTTATVVTAPPEAQTAVSATAPEPASAPQSPAAPTAPVETELPLITTTPVLVPAG